MKQLVICLLFTVPAHNAYALEIAGTWKNDKGPAWIEISVNEDAVAIGTVKRNEHNPGAVGQVLLRDLVADAKESNLWHGQIYAARLGEFKDAEVRVVEGGRLEITVKMGFMSRTVGWTRDTPSS